MRKLMLISLLGSSILLSGCSNVLTADSSNSASTVKSKSDTTNITPNVVMKKPIVHEIFYANYDGSLDFTSAVNKVSTEVDAYLASIKNIKDYHVNITSSNNFDVSGGGYKYSIVDTNNYIYAITVFLVHK